MCDVLDRIEEKAKNETTMKYIKNIMESLGVTAQQAMEILKIPVEERGMYIEAMTGK